MDKRTDQDLALAAASGDERAFVEIVRRYQAMVTAVTLGVLREFPASEDAAQDTFLIAWQKMTKLRDPSRLRSWLGQIARNTALKHLRRERARDELKDDLVDPGFRPDEQLASREEYVAVQKMLYQLPENYRLPLVLFYRDEQSTAAVAEALGVSEAATAKRLSRGRALLREKLDDFLKSAISRTSPGAAFTIAVAGGVGALTPPASLATSVVNQKAATSTLSLMTTGKMISTACGILACFPLGYFAQSLMESQSLEKVQTFRSAERSPRLNPTGAIDPFLLAEWRQLRAQAGPGQRGFISLFDDLELMPAGFRKGVFTAALLADWADEEPHAGLAFLIGKNGPRGVWVDRFLGDWLRLDREAALLAISQLENAHEFIGLAVLQAAADAPLHELSVVLAGQDGRYGQLIQKIIKQRSESNLANVREWIVAEKEMQKPWIVEPFLRVWGERDAETCSRWYHETFGDGGPALNQTYLKVMASISPHILLDQLGGGEQSLNLSLSEAAIVAVSSLARTDFSKAMEWVAQNEARFVESKDPFQEDLYEPLKATIKDLLGDDLDAVLSVVLLPSNEKNWHLVAQSLEGENRQKMWQWLRAQSDQKKAKEFGLMVLREGEFDDWAVDTSMIAAEGSRSMRHKMWNSVVGRFSEIRSSSERSSRVERLLSTMDRSLAHEMRQVALGEIIPYESGDLALWEQAYAETSGAQRIQAAQALGAAKGRRDPLSALKWAIDQAVGAPRLAALEGVYQSWSQDRSEAARSHLDVMEGDEREAAFRGYVMGLSQSDIGLAAELIFSEFDESVGEQLSRRVFNLTLSQHNKERSLLVLDALSKAGLSHEGYQLLRAEISTVIESPFANE